MKKIILSILFVLMTTSCADKTAILSFEEAKTSDGATLTASLKGRSIFELINAWGEPMAGGSRLSSLFYLGDNDLMIQVFFSEKTKEISFVRYCYRSYVLPFEILSVNETERKNGTKEKEYLLSIQNETGYDIITPVLQFSLYGNITNRGNLKSDGCLYLYEQYLNQKEKITVSVFIQGVGDFGLMQSQEEDQE